MALSHQQRALLERLTAGQRTQLSARLGSPPMQGFGLVAEGLQACGIERLCGVPGTPIDAIFREAAARGIRCLTSRQQTPAVLIAATANYLSGRLANAVLVSAGPAVTQTMTGLLFARDNGWPVLVMGGRRAVRDEGAGYFQELDAIPMMTPLTKWCATVREPADLIPTLREAAEVAIAGVPGPVYLDLPEDVLYGKAVPAPVAAPVRRPSPPAPEADVWRALDLLRAAERPLLCLGDGVRWDYDAAALRGLVEHEALPFITTSLGRGLLPDAHALCMNAVRHQVQPLSDLVLMVGAWFDWRFRRGAGLGAHAAVIHVEPDEARLGRNVNPALAVAGNGGDFLTRLAVAGRSMEPPDRGAWLAELEALEAPAAPSVPAPTGAADGPIRLPDLYGALREVLPPDAVVVLEGSFHMAHGHHSFDVNRPLSWLDPGWNGLIGGGLPMALGARLVYPGRPIVAIVGDTGFGMSGMELETAARYDLPVLVVIVNNGGINGRVRQRAFMGERHPEPVFTFSDGLRYDAVAQALGASAAWITREEDLRPAFVAAFESQSLTCLNVQVDPDAPAPRFW